MTDFMYNLFAEWAESNRQLLAPVTRIELQRTIFGWNQQQVFSSHISYALRRWPPRMSILHVNLWSRFSIDNAKISKNS